MSLFDPVFYRNAYPDLMAVYRNNDHKGLATHFMEHGVNEGRLCSRELFEQVYKSVKVSQVKHTVKTKYGLEFPNIEQTLVWVWTSKAQLNTKTKKVPKKRKKVRVQIGLNNKIKEYAKNKNIVINSHSNLGITGGDTIMLSNWLNEILPHARHVTILSIYNIPANFNRNIEYNNYSTITLSSNDQIINHLQLHQSDYDYIILRNHEILKNITDINGVKYKFLSKTILYGLNVHLPYICKLKNSFLYVVTQSETLKQKYVNKGICKSKIIIQKPITKYWDFKDLNRSSKILRLIYCGTLRKEENIIEIINEFKTIRKTNSNVELSIVYGKIHGDASFTKIINTYIKNGVHGITFKHNLTHQQACYEIARSDIGICWRSPGYGGGEISTKVLEYETYGLMVIDNLKQRSKTFYVLAQSIIDVKNGYGVRTHQILSMLPNTIALINPIKSFSNLNIDFDNRCENYNGVQYCYYNEHKIKLLYKFFNIKKTIVTVNYLNFLNFHNNFKNQKTSFVYDVRGLWYLSHLTVLEYKYKKKFSELPARQRNEINKQFAQEQKVFDLCDSCIFICSEIKDYVVKKFNYNKPYKIIENFVTGKPYVRKNNIKHSPFCIGYFGSITPYENIDLLCKTVQQLNMEGIPVRLTIVGTIHDVIGNDLNKFFKKDYIKYEPWSNDLEEYYNEIDLYCIPRSSTDVTNAVLPLKPYEILHRKIPLLTSDCTVLQNLSNNGKHFMTFERENPIDLYNKILNCIKIGYNQSTIDRGYNYVIKSSQITRNSIKDVFK